MASDIKVNQQVIQTILSKVASFTEGLSEERDSLRRVISMAEQEGWTDSSYVKFKEQFSETEVLIEQLLGNLTENNIPFLQKILRKIEEF